MIDLIAVLLSDLSAITYFLDASHPDVCCCCVSCATMSISCSVCLWMQFVCCRIFRCTTYTSYSASASDGCGKDFMVLCVLLSSLRNLDIYSHSAISSAAGFGNGHEIDLHGLSVQGLLSCVIRGVISA